MRKREKKVLPFIHLFETAAGYYFYDVNRDQFVPVSEAVYAFLKQEQEGGVVTASSETMSELDELKLAGYLKHNRVKRARHPLTDVVKYYHQYKIRHLILQVTQNCNLRCEYCVYSGEYANRTHSTKQMSFETARKALDYYIAHSRDNEQLSVGFYGGEPCLNFSLIKQCISYLETAAEGRTMMYSMTTNATPLDEEIIEYLVQHDFQLMISLDGPQEIHDKHRRFAFTKKGTFEIVQEKVWYIKEKYPSFFQRNLKFNTVLNVENNFSVIEEFARNHEVFREARFQSTVIDTKGTEKTYKARVDYIEETNYEFFKILLELLGELPEGSSSKLLQNYGNNLRKVLTKNYAPVGGELPEQYYHGGPCIPGTTRLFVTVDGIFYPCERVSEESKLSVIGNVETGIDLEAVKNILNFDVEREKTCSNCWAYLRCDQCIAHRRESDEKSDYYCAVTRHRVENELKDASMLQALGCDSILVNANV